MAKATQPTPDPVLDSILPPLVDETIAPEPVADSPAPVAEVEALQSPDDLIDFEEYKVSVESEYQFNKKTGGQDKVFLYTKEKNIRVTRIMRSQAETLNDQSMNSFLRYYPVS